MVTNVVDVQISFETTSPLKTSDSFFSLAFFFETNKYKEPVHLHSLNEANSHPYSSIKEVREFLTSFFSQGSPKINSFFLIPKGEGISYADAVYEHRYDSFYYILLATKDTREINSVVTRLEENDLTNIVFCSQQESSVADLKKSEKLVAFVSGVGGVKPNDCSLLLDSYTEFSPDSNTAHITKEVCGGDEPDREHTRRHS